MCWYSLTRQCRPNPAWNILKMIFILEIRHFRNASSEHEVILIRHSHNCLLIHLECIEIIITEFISNVVLRVLQPLFMRAMGWKLKQWTLFTSQVGKFVSLYIGIYTVPCPYDRPIIAKGLCNIGFPSETHPKLKSRSYITSVSIPQSLWLFAQSTAVSLPCSCAKLHND